jgi:hypothetical protein
MENSPFGFLFGNTSTNAAHVDEPPPPPPAEIDPFKIPIKLLGVLWITAIQEMELSIWVITYYLYMNYASCSGVQVFHQARSRRSYSLYH